MPTKGELRLPVPLPYDVVDRLIDETYTFNQEPYANDPENLIYTNCIHNHLPLHNYGRMLFELLEDGTRYYENKEDEEGYHTWHGGDGMCWTAEWSEEENEEMLEREIAATY